MEASDEQWDNWGETGDDGREIGNRVGKQRNARLWISASTVPRISNSEPDVAAEETTLVPRLRCSNRIDEFMTATMSTTTATTPSRRGGRHLIDERTNGRTDCLSDRLRWWCSAAVYYGVYRQRISKTSCRRHHRLPRRHPPPPWPPLLLSCMCW